MTFILSDRPIFVVGSPRSGTTLMRSILDSHPQIFCPEWETGFFVAMEPVLNGDIREVFVKFPTFPVDRAALIAWARESAESLFRRFAEKCGKWRWTEKTPAHALHLPLIHEVFPNAQIVHMIRSGYDVVKSLRSMPWTPKGRLRPVRWSSRMWVDCVTAARTAGADLPKGQYWEIRYEELLREPERVVRALCDYLQEPFAPQMLEFHKAESRSFKSDAAPLQAKPLGKYEELGILERLVFRRIAGRLMRELNYV